MSVSSESENLELKENGKKDKDQEMKSESDSIEDQEKMEKKEEPEKIAEPKILEEPEKKDETEKKESASDGSEKMIKDKHKSKKKIGMRKAIKLRLPLIKLNYFTCRFQLLSPPGKREH